MWNLGMADIANATPEEVTGIMKVRGSLSPSIEELMISQSLTAPDGKEPESQIVRLT
jgi:hypothetical protein